MTTEKKEPHIDLSPDVRYERVLTCGAPERAEWIAKEFLQDARPVARKREYHSYLGRYDGKDVLVISHGVGAPGAMICFQELVHVGAKTIIRVGTAGGLYDGTKVGDLVVATSAIRRDGVSALMVPADFPAIADEKTTALLFERLSKRVQNGQRGQNVKRGKVVTSDLFYPGILEGHLQEDADAGAIAVEMECSGLFVLGALKKIRTAAVLALDGNPLKWNEGAYDPRSDAMKIALGHAIHATLSTLAAL